MSQKLHAVIAGAGIGGLAAAVWLARAGLRVTVLERARAIEEVGAGVQLAPNATGLLQEIGLLERVLAFASAPDRIRIRRAGDGREIARMPLAVIADARWGAPYLVIHRADLQRVLLEACAAESEITIRTGLHVTGFAVGADSVEIGARNGGEIERVTGDFLIGADGLKSAVRARLGLGMGDKPIWSGRTAWRALVRRQDAPAFALELASTLWLGPRAHLVHYPVRHGELVNVVAIADVNSRDEDEDDIWAIASEPAEISPRFLDWAPDARNLVMSAREWLRWPLYDRIPVRRWAIDRVALLGDAAHPMLPFFAQGAAQAIEDAAALGRAFSTHGEDVNGALLAYQEARRVRAGAVVMASRRQGAIYHMRGPAAFARNTVMKAVGAEGMMKRLDWLYNYAPPDAPAKTRATGE